MKFRKWICLLVVPPVAGLLTASVPAWFYYFPQRAFIQGGSDIWAFLLTASLPLLVLGIPFQYYVTWRLWMRWESLAISSARMYSTLYWYASCVSVFEIILFPDAGKGLPHILLAGLCLLLVNSVYFTADFLLFNFIWLRPQTRLAGRKSGT